MTIAGMLELLRQRGLLGKRSIVGWILLGGGPVWKLLSSASTVSWIWGVLSRTTAPPHRSMFGGGMPGDASTISTVLFVAGIAWLTAIVYLPVVRPNIYAKMMRTAFVARHPFDDLTRSMMQTLKASLGPTEHDLIVKLFVVNRSIWPTTIQRIEAEAEVDGKWIKLCPSELDHYADEKVEDRKLANTGLRSFGTKKIPLDDLRTNLNDEPLRRGIHKDGWVAFGLKVEPEKVEGKKVLFRLTIVDALDGRHKVFDVGEIEKDCQITYSDKATKGAMRYEE